MSGMSVRSTTIGEILHLEEFLHHGLVVIHLPPSQGVDGFLVGDLVKPIDSNFGAPIHPRPAPDFLAYKVMARHQYLNTVHLMMVDSTENFIRTATCSNLVPGSRFYVHKAASNILVPLPVVAVASDRWPPGRAGLWNPENWGETPETSVKNKQRCPKDSHKHADTGMRVSYCVRCNAKLSFENWEWKEVLE